MHLLMRMIGDAVMELTGYVANDRRYIVPSSRNNVR